MAKEQETTQRAAAGQTGIWLVLAAAQPEGAVTAFWELADATAHAEQLRASDPDVSSVVREVVVQGSRRRCRLCGEPVLLDDPSNPMSWIPRCGRERPWRSHG